MGLFDGLPSGWSQAKDDQGRTYYFNRNTGENTYVKPEKPKKEKKAGSLPAGWASAMDAQGKEYFFNSSTGETTYTRPVTAPQLKNKMAAIGYAGNAPAASLICASQ